MLFHRIIFGRVVHLQLKTIFSFNSLAHGDDLPVPCRFIGSTFVGSLQELPAIMLIVTVPICQGDVPTIIICMLVPSSTRCCQTVAVTKKFLFSFPTCTILLPLEC